MNVDHLLFVSMHFIGFFLTQFIDGEMRCEKALQFSYFIVLKEYGSTLINKNYRYASISKMVTTLSVPYDK
jgi:hypothetical protein